MIIIINIAICDDETHFIDHLQSLLEKYAEEYNLDFIIYTFTNGIKLLEYTHLNFDLIFLDIRMDMLNGLQVANEIRKVNKQVSIIFLTSEAQYAIEGYQYNAYNYILKPIKYIRLKFEMNKWVSNFHQEEKPSIIIENNQSKHKVFLNTLYYAETFNRNIMLHTKEENILCFSKMKDLEEELESHGFIRCHTSFIVNLHYVKRVKKLEIELINGENIPISQPKRKVTMKRLAEYWGERL